MDIIFLLIGLACSLLGVYLIVKAMITRARGAVVEGQIIGFQKKRNKSKRLPAVLFEDASGIEITSRATAIDSVTYWIKPLEMGEQISVMIQKQNPEICSIHGYMSLIAGFFLQWPLIFYVFTTYASEMMQGRLGFIFVLLSIIGGFWVFLRIVRFHYA